MMQFEFQVVPLYSLAFQIKHVLTILQSNLHLTLRYDFGWSSHKIDFGGGSCHLGCQGGWLSNNYLTILSCKCNNPDDIAKV
jgi:hypothetical protein